MKYIHLTDSAWRSENTNPTVFPHLVVIETFDEAQHLHGQAVIRWCGLTSRYVCGQSLWEWLQRHVGEENIHWMLMDPLHLSYRDPYYLRIAFVRKDHAMLFRLTYA